MSEKYTLEKIFSLFPKGICVPRIQRGYVQGRKDEKGLEIRKSFAPALVKAVFGGGELSLDFIYGVSREQCLLPLDGQQRLSTLFLLAWLCGKWQSDWCFTYEARRIPQLFVKGLLEHPCKAEGLPSVEIKGSGWFLPIWEKDPSVDGMLQMLDALHEALGQHNRADADFGRISFLLHGIDGFSDTFDHIFQKMNSRGKELSPWENVKAVIDKYVQNHLDWKQDINLKWPERIWPLVDKDISRLDENMLEVVGEALKYAEYKHNADDTFQLDTWMEANPTEVKKFFDCAETLFSATEIHDDLLLQAMKPCWEKTSLKPYFGKIDEFCKKHLAAYYAAQKSTNADWMRVIWNIIENSNSGSNLPATLKLIDELAEHCDDILEFLASDTKIHSDFAREQLKEEREKARLVCDDNSWHGVLMGAEAYPFIKGRVSVILEATARDKLAFSKLVSICAQMLQKPKDMIESFKSYLSYAQDCDLPLWYDKDFFNPDKWKQMFFNDTSKKGVITWLQAELLLRLWTNPEYAWLKENTEHQTTQNNWSENLQDHWNDICPKPNEYYGIAKYSHGWGNNKVFLYRTSDIRGAQLISVSLREDLVKGLCGSTKVRYYYYGYDRVIELDNGLKVIHRPDDYVFVHKNNMPLDKIGRYQLPVQLTAETLNDFIKDCLEYK